MCEPLKLADLMGKLIRKKGSQYFSVGNIAVFSLSLFFPVSGTFKISDLPHPALLDQRFLAPVSRLQFSFYVFCESPVASTEPL